MPVTSAVKEGLNIENLERSVSKLEKAIDEAKETIATFTNLALLLRLPRHTPRSLRRAVVLLP